MRVLGSLSAGSALDNVTRTLPLVIRFARPARMPGCATPSETMNTLVSSPAVSPLWARPLLPSAFALTMNWRRLPAPVSFAFTMVSKLKPKSMPLTSALPSVAGVTDCATVVAVVSVASAAFVVFAAASARAGTSPPTRSVTATALPVVASLR